MLTAARTGRARRWTVAAAGTAVTAEMRAVGGGRFGSLQDVYGVHYHPVRGASFLWREMRADSDYILIC